MGETRRSSQASPPSPLHTTPILLFLFLFLVSSSEQVFGAGLGPRCERYEVTGKSKCDEFLGNRTIFLPANVTQDTIQQKVIHPQAILLGAYLPRTCRSLALQLLCVEALPPCSIINSTSLAVILPCQDLCVGMVESCNETFYAVGKENTLPTAICPFLPSSNCFNITSYTAPVYKQEDCPYPTKINTDTNQDTLGDPSSLCVYPCPFPFYTEEEYNGGFITSYVISFISFFTGLFMIATWMLSPVKRRFPANIVLWLAITATGVDAAMVWMVLWGGTPEVVCTQDNPPTLVRMRTASGHDTGCIIQGIMLYYFATAANLWWLGVVVHLFEVIVLQLDQKFVKWFYYGYHVLAWGFPAIGVIISLSAQQMSGTEANAYCFAADIQSSQSEYNGYVYALYFGPSFISLFLGTFLVFIIFGILLKHKLKLKTRSSITFWHLLRMLTLIALFWWLLIWIDIHGIYGSAVTGAVEDAIHDQVRCSALTGTECEISKRPEYAIWWLNLFNISSTATIIFLCIGATQETFMFWWRLGKAVFSSRDPKVWWLMVKQELTLAPGSDKRSDYSKGSSSRTTNPSNNTDHASKISRSTSSETDDEDDDDTEASIEEGAL